MKTKEVENYLKALNFKYPEWIPAEVAILPATWRKYGDDLEKIVLNYPSLFPHYQKDDYQKIKLSLTYRKGRWLDKWGITWENIEEGLDGAPVEELAPLKDWANLEDYKIPDPLTGDFGEPIDWLQIKEEIEKVKANGGLASGGLSHGFMYMRLYYLRGFTNFMIDVATREPKLNQLIEMVLNYNLQLVNKWIEIGVEIIRCGDDLGLQRSLPISPEDWRRLLKPSFAQIFGLCRKNGVYVDFHTDGHILEIIPDLIECGVSILNPQVRANTLKGLEKVAKGKVCLRLDLDRQLFPFAKPTEIKEHIKEAIDTLNLPEGGLMLFAECGPDVPLENIDAICSGLKQFGGGPMP